MAVLSNKDLKDLALAISKAQTTPACNFSFGGETFTQNELETTMQAQMRELVGVTATGEVDVHGFEQNEPLIYSLMEVMIGEAVTKYVEEQYKEIAEFKSFGLTEKPVFRVRTTLASRRRALTYVMRGATEGIYDTFELAGQSFEGKIFDLTAAGRISYTDFITGEITLADIMSIITEGFNRRVNEAIADAVVAMINTMDPTRKGASSGFDEGIFDLLLQKADSFGTGPSYIYCTKRFAADIFKYTTSNANVINGLYSGAQKEEMFKNGGFLRWYKGMYPIVILEQGFRDESLTEKVMPDHLCLITPNNGLVNGKPIKLGKLGGTHLRRREQTDYSIVIDACQSFSLAIVCDDDLFSYENSSLKDSKANEFGL